MRFTPASIALAVVLTTVSSVGLTQRPDSQISPRSIEWQKAGEAARKAGNLQGATDALESALTVDQGEAMVEKGAIAKAKENLAQAQSICKSECPAVGKLAVAIEKGPPATVLSAKEEEPAPKVAATETP